jgi:hypothetical protein
VSRLELRDELALADSLALRDERDDGLVAGDDPAPVVDREHSAVDDPPREAHDAVGRCRDLVPSRGDVDASVARHPGFWRADEGPQDAAQPRDRP